jgi:hypothetical protein
MGLKRKRCPVLPVPHFLVSNVRHDVAIAGTIKLLPELNRRPRYKRAMLALWLMTALGPSRPKWAVRAMSGLPPVATELRTSMAVRFVPTSDIDHGWRLSQRGS